jgi:hypothetical protein
MDIEQRNRLRVEASLPLLDVPTELARLKKAEDEAEFEKYFQLRRDQFLRLRWAWTGKIKPGRAFKAQK